MAHAERRLRAHPAAAGEPPTGATGGAGRRQGLRRAPGLPPLQQAWCIGLTALDAEAIDRYQLPFAVLPGYRQDALLAAMQHGQLKHEAWDGMPAAVFFAHRLVHDITSAYYAHPTAWNEIGFGGPASPRGYVRLDRNQRDAWEPAEAKPRQAHTALELNRRVR